MDPTRVLLYVMVCVGLHQSFANSCEIYRFEDEQIKAFENHVIKTMTTSMKELCRGACVRLHKCFSINVRPSKFPGFVECDLNNSSKKASPGSLVTRAESEYHQMGKVDERNRKNYIEVIKEVILHRFIIVYCIVVYSSVVVVVVVEVVVVVVK
ncbi:hypothetical protein QZH41_007794 [Actinostola sp. cb2023]|nr:hypothetical protein QZH41_007794 [Actinostola sp. cb2023]